MSISFTNNIRLEPATRQIVQGAQQGLVMAGEYLLAASRRVVPLETAALAHSGAVSAAGNQVAVSYDTPYAVRQHEELGWAHDQGRQAKYLEGPLIEHQQKLVELIAEKARI